MDMKRGFFILAIIEALLIFSGSCRKNDDDNNPSIPKLTTEEVSDITQFTATCGGNVIFQGNSPITLRGVCLDTSENPTISDAITLDGSGAGNFKSKLTGLDSSTRYYIRAYAINSAGTAYGNQVRFNTTGSIDDRPCCGQNTVTDPRDGQVYPIVQIGNQCWLQKNMNYKTGNNWSYENDTSNCDIFGRLYDWYTAQDVCPSGWHLPSDAEWAELTSFLGEEYIAGGKMKSTSGWYNNGNGTNSSGFNALPAGNCYRNSLFNGITSRAYFWTSTQTSTTYSWNRHLYYNEEELFRDNYSKTHGFSVRCVRD
jgi:uncharacterized protein (TIGR02145 family)